MSDPIKHECGLAFIRLRKPFPYYLKAYGTAMYGLNKLYLLMEKQHNRGQDGAGIAAVKLNTEPGYPFLHRIRSIETMAIADLFRQISEEIAELEKYQPDIKKHPGLMKGNIRFMGELLLGHLETRRFFPDEATVRRALGELGRRRWIRGASGHSSRVAKYRQLFEEEMRLDPDQVAVLAGLMLAGCAGDVPVPFVNVALPPAGPGPAPDYPNVGVKPNSNTNEAPVMTEAERQAVEDQLKKLVSDREGNVKKRIDSSN